MMGAVSSLTVLRGSYRGFADHDEITRELDGREFAFPVYGVVRKGRRMFVTFAREGWKAHGWWTEVA